MNIRVVAALCLVSSVASTAAIPADRMRFGDLTSTTIAKLYFAPASTAKWGPNRCVNDLDGTVSMDERLELKGVAPRHYDVKVIDLPDRTRVVKDVTLQAGNGYAFSLSEADLKDCTK